MSPDTGVVNALPAGASDDIEVRRAVDPGASIAAAARRWALAFEARQRDGAMSSEESSELALYDRVAEVDELRQAELALYQAVIAADTPAT